MDVLKVVAEGITTSFRYPHFMHQIHPTLPMPPPATIYGHIASALGEWFEPDGVSFAYHFTYSATSKDLEHIIVLSPATGKLEESQAPKVLEGRINPFERQLFFQPKLTLYINRPEWASAFRSPKYAVVLGRSQDLFTYTQVKTIKLEQDERAYFEGTLLPYKANRFTNHGIAILMPRYIDYHAGRRPTFERYFVVQDRINTDKDFLWFGERPEVRYWIDPESPEIEQSRRGLSFLGFVGPDDET